MTFTEQSCFQLQLQIKATEQRYNSYNWHTEERCASHRQIQPLLKKGFFPSTSELHNMSFSRTIPVVFCLMYVYFTLLEPTSVEKLYNNVSHRIYCYCHKWIEANCFPKEERVTAYLTRFITEVKGTDCLLHDQLCPVICHIYCSHQTGMQDLDAAIMGSLIISLNKKYSLRNRQEVQHNTADLLLHFNNV